MTREDFQVKAHNCESKHNYGNINNNHPIYYFDPFIFGVFKNIVIQDMDKPFIVNHLIVRFYASDSYIIQSLE